MLRVTMITGSLPPIKCGVGDYTYQLLNELKKTDINLAVISSKGVNQLDLPMVLTPSWKIRALPSLLKTIASTKPDVVHIQYPAVGYGHQLGINLLPYLIRLRFPRKQLIITQHEYSASRLIGRVRDYITIHPAKKILVSNEADKDAMPKRLQKKVEIIPIGSSISIAKSEPKYYEQVLKKGGLSPEKTTLTFFGFAHQTKGLELLLGALTDHRLGDFQLLLMTGLSAKDPYQSSLIKMIDKINSSGKRVYLTGYLPSDKVSALLQSSKYFVLPQNSPVNGKSSSAVAAISHGLILIGSGSDNQSESLPYVSKQNAYLVYPMSEQALVEAIVEVTTSAGLQKKLEAGTKKLAGHFSWDNIVKRHKEVYSSGR